MSVFSSANILKAIQRVPATATKDLQELLKRAQANGLNDLMEAIEAEISLRGPMNLDAIAAHQHVRWADQVAGMHLSASIQTAFKEVPPKEYELPLIQEIARNPGVSYQALLDFRKKGDVGLILGHLVYDRLGFFRAFLPGKKNISDMLLFREQVSGEMTYRLTTEAEQAFRVLDLI